MMVRLKSERVMLIGLLLLLLSPLPVAADQGGIWHTIRLADGSWLNFGNVKALAGDPGNVLDVADAGDIASGDLHVLGTTFDGRLWHTIRAADGTWLQFGRVDVKAQAGDPGPIYAVASGLIGCNLHVLVAANFPSGDLFHTIRSCDGTWLQFGNVKSQAGDPGAFVDLSIAGNAATGELHVIGSTTDGSLWHTIRAADGTWLQFGNVKGQAGDPGRVGYVASALIGCNLHVVVETSTGGLFHTIRSCDGTWLQFGDVKSQAGDPGAFFDVSIAGNDATGELHVVGSLGQGALTGPMHTIRAADGTWLQFGDVGGQAGRPGECGLVAVHSALIQGGLHVLVSTSICIG